MSEIGRADVARRAARDVGGRCLQWIAGGLELVLSDALLLRVEVCLLDLVRARVDDWTPAPNDKTVIMT